MKYFVPTKGDKARLSKTLSWLVSTGVDWKLLVADSATMDRILQDFEHFEIDAYRFHVTGLKDAGLLNMVNIRDYVLRELVSRDEWYCSLDDNIVGLRGPYSDGGYGFTDETKFDFAMEDPDVWDTWRQAFDENCSDNLDSIVDELRAKCEKEGTNYGGFAYQPNHFWRAKKWMTRKYVKGKMFIHKPDGHPFRECDEIILLSDLAKTLDTIDRYGKVVVNQYIYPKCAMHEPGGIGSKETRYEAELSTVRFLTRKYGGLCEFDGRDIDSFRFSRGKR